MTSVAQASPVERSSSKMILPLHKRYEIAFLHHHRKGPKLSYRDIAKIVNCSVDTVSFWANVWLETKDLTSEPKTGRKRSTTAKDDKKIVKLAKKDDNATSFTIQQEMSRGGVEVSARTIRRRLREAGGKYNQPIRKPLLSDGHMEKRLQWANKHIDFDWKNAIFTDESTFVLHLSPKKVWNFPGKKKIFRTVKHSIKINVWGCFSASGFGRLICFRQNLNGAYMCEIYKRGLLPSAEKHFGQGNLDWILVEDNDPKHKSKIAQRWKAENNVKNLPWPAMSPDQNPIENVWRILKIKICKKKINSVYSFVAELHREWNNLPNILAYNLVASMEKRVLALIEARGDYTMY